MASHGYILVTVLYTQVSAPPLLPQEKKNYLKSFSFVLLMLMLPSHYTEPDFDCFILQE